MLRRHSRLTPAGTLQLRPSRAWLGAVLVLGVSVLAVFIMVTAKAGPIFSDRFEPWPFNDTGIDTCGSASANLLPCPVADFPGQDGDFGRDALARAGQLQKIGGGVAGFDFTKLDPAGQALPASASSWDCVHDNVTGLTWEVKRNQSGHLRHVLSVYSWYDPNPASNGGDAGLANGGFCSGSACDTHAFVQAVNAQGLCGASDWRLPSLAELNDLANRSRLIPALDTDYFPWIPNMQFRYWTSNTSAVDPAEAWRWDIGNGFDWRDPKTSAHGVRLVRGPQR